MREPLLPTVLRSRGRNNSEHDIMRAADHIEELRAENADLRKALGKALVFIDCVRQDLHSQRATDWYPEGAHDAASSMSEIMRLIGNSCAEFEAISPSIEEPSAMTSAEGVAAPQLREDI